MKGKSVFTTATITNKSDGNEDNKGEIPHNLFNAVLVADGLGSYKYAQRASDSVIDTLLKELKNIEDISHLDFEKLFKIAKTDLIELAEATKTDEDENAEYLFGTTVIVLVETEKSIRIGYVGNGAIWHIRGHFDGFPAAYPFPWNAVNILNPHSVEQDGKEALYRLISDNPNDYTECIPTEIEIQKDSCQGDIFMICSDGIYSEDQRSIGTNSKGIWVKYEKTMQKFFEGLRVFFENPSEYTNDALNTALQLYLEEIKSDLDDDATLGVLITKEALNYQRNKKQKQMNENHTNK